MLIFFPSDNPQRLWRAGRRDGRESAARRRDGCAGAVSARCRAEFAGPSRRCRAPVFVQSFEAANLRELRTAHRVKAPLVFLAGAGSPYNDPKPYEQYLAPAGLRELAGIVDGIGPEKGLVIPRAADGSLGTPTSLITDAHAQGRRVHPYTFRAENQFLPVNLRNGTVPAEYGRILDELAAYLAAGVDGVFTDHPDLGVLARSLA
ncbi:glycerophosphodiester phosphodiesterase family protein [Catellatospora sp. NPDC049609]|uniref:glycerophosphodiester phosphodiesterase family protein n=1 Tax=Catellatospora sp. NPDC049609 TaxID=3155505 RepID=UPI003431C889